MRATSPVRDKAPAAWRPLVTALALIALLAIVPDVAVAQTGESKPPELSIGGVTIDEPEAGESAIARFNVVLSRSSERPVEVSYNTVDGLAGAEDYEAREGRLRLEPGRTAARIEVTVLGDGEQEPNERFLVMLSDPSGATIANELARATIVDNTATPSDLDAILAFLVAATAALLLVSPAERIARRIGAIDYPNERSLHLVPTPKLGGLAILAGVLIGGLIFLPADTETHAILAGALAIALVGVADDIFDLPPGIKLLGQTGAAVIPVSQGVTVAAFTLPFIGGVEPGNVELLGSIDLGDVATVIGIVAIVNVINLTDGVDGLAAGVCVIAAGALAVIALSLDRNAAGVLAAITAGAALGFLRHGFPPASSFMGDTGSNLLGYLLACIAIQGALKTNAVVALFLPLIVLAVPILDTGFVVAKRIKYRRPIYRPDRWHFHHRMANLGFSQRRTLAYLYGWALVMAGLGLALRFVPYSDDGGNFDPLWTAVIAACLVAALAASVYLVVTLEILKLRGFRGRQLAVARPEVPPAPEEVDEGVARELETGSFEALDPDTGEFRALDPETGEFDAIR